MTNQWIWYSYLYNINAGRILFLLCLVALKRAGWFLFDGQMKALNLRIRTGYVLASWGHRRHPWRWQSSSWRVRCRWRHPWWRSQGKPWGLHGSPHRWDQRYAWLLHGEPNAWWRAWWFPGCCLSTPYGDAWRLPFRVPFLLCHVQSCCCCISNWWLNPQPVLFISGIRANDGPATGHWLQGWHDQGCQKTFK